MKKNNIKKILCIMLVGLIATSVNVYGLNIKTKNTTIESQNTFRSNEQNSQVEKLNSDDDFDPLVDVKITVTIKEIRALDKIDLLNDPDFYVKVIIEDEEYQSNVFVQNEKYVKPNWSVEHNVPDDKEYVNITIQLWDADPFIDDLCDIAKNDNDKPYRRDISIRYNIKNGHWLGDDYIYPFFSWFDYSGYGRANGCDDNSIYSNDKDCELWFDVSQNDFDNDGIPYWTEVNVFGTDPEIDNRGEDNDGDGIPIEWEYKWGYFLKRNYTKNNTVEFEDVWLYHPTKYDNHSTLDPDNDGLNNVEEYLTSNWGSDPFRKDVFVELDQMNGSNDGIPASILPEESKELIRDAFDRQNIVFHLDDGTWSNTGSEMIPFDYTGDNTTREECREIYKDYYLHRDNDTWRKGVFHYGIVVNNATWAGYNFQRGAFQISREYMEKKASNPLLGNRAVVYASCYMHELGHSLGLTWLGGHQINAGNPLHPLWWKFRSYESIMNYGYMYGMFGYDLVDYSDGSNGRNDFDDWSNIDFNYFQQEL